VTGGAESILFRLIRLVGSDGGDDQLPGGGSGRAGVPVTVYVLDDEAPEGQARAQSRLVPETQDVGVDLDVAAVRVPGGGVERHELPVDVRDLAPDFSSVRLGDDRPPRVGRVSSLPAVDVRGVPVERHLAAGTQRSTRVVQGLQPVVVPREDL
jgi:hypothetical protein